MASGGARARAPSYRSASIALDAAPSCRCPAAGIIHAQSEQMTSTADLKKRVETRKQELIDTLRELKNSTADDAATTRDAIKKRLSELGHVLKEGVVKGWEDVGDVARSRIERWLEA